MREWITTCIILSLCGGILKLILMAAGSEKAAKALQTILSVLILSLAVSSLCRENLPSVTLAEDVRYEYYEQMQEETFAEVFATVEKELGTALGMELKNKFGHEPLACTVAVDRETLELSDIKIYYAADSMAISTYEIKNYIYTTYGTQAEVIFENE